MPALVSALNSVDLPTLGRPTMPHLRLMAIPSLFGALRVQRHHRALHVAARDVGPRVERAVDRRVDARALVGARRLQHVVDDVLLRKQRIARMADADAKPPEVGRAERRLDVAQPVVARHAAAELHLRLTGLEIELVVNDEDLVGRDAEKARERADRAAGLIHVRRRLDEANIARLARRRRRSAPLPRAARRARARARRRTRSPRCAASPRIRGPDCRAPRRVESVVIDRR